MRREALEGALAVRRAVRHDGTRSTAARHKPPRYDFRLNPREQSEGSS